MFKILKDYFQLLITFPKHQSIFFRKQFDALWPLLSFVAKNYRRWVIPRKKCIAVVGSLGKTTTKRALRSIFVVAKRKQMFSNYRSALAVNLLVSHPKDSYDVFEVGIDTPNEMKPYAQMIQPNIVVVTSIKSEHNRSFPTFQDMREEKVGMVRALAKNGLAVLNGDDPDVMWMATQTKAETITFGASSQCDVWAENIKNNWPQGISFKLYVKDQSFSIQTKILGEHMVFPLLSSVAVASYEGIDIHKAIKTLEQLKPVQSRLEHIKLKNDITIVDDTFKGSIESFYSAINVFKSIQCQRKVLIIGDIQEPPGSQGPVYRGLGIHAAKTFDKVIYIGQNMQKLKTGLTRGGMKSSEIIDAGKNILEGIKMIESELKAGDVILIKARSSQQHRRITLALLGKDVRCNVRYCNIKVDVCDDCPLISCEEKVFQNHFIKALTRM